MKRNITRDVSFEVSETQAEDSDGRTLDGYASVFNAPTRIRSHEGDFTETIAPGAFKKTLAERKPVLQYNHGRDARIGTVPIGTFESVEEDDHGLHTVGRLFDHPDVDRVRQAIQSGDIKGMSFTFNVIRDEWTDKNGRQVTGRELERMLYKGELNRNIKEVKLVEAGPVLYPAYEGTSVGVRSADDLDDEERQEIVESYCRTAGLEIDEDDERAKPPVPPKKDDKKADDEEEDPKKGKTPPPDGKRPDDSKKPPADGEEPDSDESDDSEEEDDPKKKGKKPPFPPKKESKSSDTDAAIQRTSESDQKDRAADESTRSTSTKSTATKGKRVATINEMRERIAAIEVRMEELGTEYRDADLPEAEATEFDEIVAERSALLETIDKVQARLDLIKKISTDKPQNEDKKGAPAVHIRGAVHDLHEIRNSVSSEEAYREAVHDSAMRFIDSKDFKPAGERAAREDAQESVEMNLDLPGRDDSGHTIAERVLATSTPMYERAWAKAARAGSEGVLDAEERAALQLGVAASGGYAIPVQLDPTIIWTNAGVINPLRQLARVEKIVGKEWQGVTSSGTSVRRNLEGLESSESSFTLNQVTVTTQRVDGFTPFTFEAEISWAAMRSAIAHAISEAKDAEEANAFLLGVGTVDTSADPDLPRANGLLGTLSGNTVTIGTGGTFKVSDLFALEDALDARYQANASWLAHKAFYNKVRQLDEYGGSKLWARIGEGQPQTLLDYPTYRSTLMDSNPIVDGKKVAILGDFKNFLIVDRIGMNAELVPHVFGTNHRPTGQRGIFAWWMNNSKVLVDAAFKVLVGDDGVA